MAEGKEGKEGKKEAIEARVTSLEARVRMLIKSIKHIEKQFGLDLDSDGKAGSSRLSILIGIAFVGILVAFAHADQNYPGPGEAPDLANWNRKAAIRSDGSFTSDGSIAIAGSVTATGQVTHVVGPGYTVVVAASNMTEVVATNMPVCISSNSPIYIKAKYGTNDVFIKAWKYLP